MSIDAKQLGVTHDGQTITNGYYFIPYENYTFVYFSLMMALTFTKGFL